MDPKLPERFTSIWMLFSVGLMLAAWRISNTLVPGSFSVMSNWFGFCRGVTISRVAVDDDLLDLLVVRHVEDGGEASALGALSGREQREENGYDSHEDNQVDERVTDPTFAHGSMP